MLGIINEHSVCYNMAIEHYTTTRVILSLGNK
jgi:hypothetical protein